jgi:hypothetical protein
LNEFALLCENFSRCFYGLGNGKDILVPFKEQARPMEKESATWFTFMDEKTNRLVLPVKRISFLKMKT